LTDPGPIDWKYYTPALLESRLDHGDVVVLEFTAEWCLNCKLLEGTVLHDPSVAEALAADGVTPIKIDLTGNNVFGNALLNDVGGLRIPLLIVMDSNGNEVFRGDFYTIAQVLQAINQAKGKE
jgi:thiol:disulfide interchange protein